MKKQNKIHAWRTIKGKIRISYSVILFVMCSVLFLSYFVSRSTIEKNAVESSMAALNVVSGKIESQISYLTDMSNLIYNSSTVDNCIQDLENSTKLYDWHYNYVRLYRYMQDYYDSLSMNSKECQIILWNRSQEVLYYSWAYDEPDGEEIREELGNMEGKGTKHYLKFRSSYGNPAKGNYFYFYNIYSGIQREDEEFCVIIGIREQDLKETMSALTENGSSVMLVDENIRELYQIGDIAGQQNTAIENTEHFYANEGTFVTHGANESRLNLYITLDSMNLKLVQTMEMKDVMKGFNTWWRISILCILIMVAAVFVVLYLLNRSILQPVNYLYRDMERLKEGNREIGVPDKIGKDEIGNLTKQFYEMVDQIEILEEQRVQNEKQKRKLEIEALQAQINPHFLYNTINAVKMLLRMRRAEEATAALTALVDILKHTLSNSDSYITLEQEEKFLQSYMFIQHMRYDEFDFRLEIPEEMKKYRILKFMIQPFIENSFLHGFEEITRESSIAVRVQKQDSHLEISISDNGEGMDEETVREIRICGKKERGINGIGIGNVIERIKRNYGDNYYVDICSSMGKGTHIVLILPLLTEEKEK